MPTIIIINAVGTYHHINENTLHSTRTPPDGRGGTSAKLNPKNANSNYAGDIKMINLPTPAYPVFVTTDYTTVDVGVELIKEYIKAY